MIPIHEPVTYFVPKNHARRKINVKYSSNGPILRNLQDELSVVCDEMGAKS